jgi:hypothetical protein
VREERAVKYMLLIYGNEEAFSWSARNVEP